MKGFTEHARARRAVYYEHIIRHESESNRIREYIADNPARWGEDIHNPDYGDKKCPR